MHSSCHCLTSKSKYLAQELATEVIADINIATDNTSNADKIESCDLDCSEDQNVNLITKDGEFY